MPEDPNYYYRCRLDFSWATGEHVTTLNMSAIPLHLPLPETSLYLIDVNRNLCRGESYGKTAQEADRNMRKALQQLTVFPSFATLPIK